MDYVLGFIFSRNKQEVLLIEKNRPSWQAGKLNGIGGKIEPGETPLAAIVRETSEETKLAVNNWRQYAKMRFNGNDTVHVFEAVIDRLDEAVQTTDERLFTLDVGAIRMGHPNALTNIAWLVSMSFDTGFASVLTIDYGEFNS